jgi:hypothetical protein
MTYECQECDDYEGTIKGLCQHVSIKHGEWEDYVEKHDIDTDKLSRKQRNWSKKGWRYN